MNRQNVLVGTLLVFLAAAAYACLPIFIRSIYKVESIQAADIAVWRFVFAVALVWPVLFMSGQGESVRQLSRPQTGVLLGLGGLFSVSGVTSALALERVPASTYTLLLYTYPAMVAVLSFALGEILPINKWLAVGLALLGCALTVSGPIKIKNPLDIAFPFINAFAYAVYLIIAGRYNRVSGMASGVVSMSGTLIALVILIPFWGIHTPQTTEGWLYIAGLGIISTVLPITLMFKGISMIGASNAAILSTLEPIITVFLAALILSEDISPLQLAGGGLIIASVVLLHLPMRRHLHRAAVNV